MDGSAFGEYLNKLRKAKGLTAEDLGKIMSVHPTYIHRIEQGRGGIPTPASIRRLSAALGCTHIGMMIKAGHVTEEEVRGWGIAHSPTLGSEGRGR